MAGRELLSRCCCQSKVRRHRREQRRPCEPSPDPPTQQTQHDPAPAHLRTRPLYPMGSKRPRGFLLLLLLSLQLAGGLASWILCNNPGFTQEDFYFTVPKKLKEDAVIGRVTFEHCDHSAVHFRSLDPHFEVLESGDIVVKEHIKLHKSPKKFKVVATYGKDEKFTFVNLVTRSHSHKEELPKDDVKLKRQKRDWVIPDIIVSENERGPFNKKLVQIKSSRDKETKIFYSMIGSGADSPPVGVFIVELETGWIYVTRPLDREDIARYIFQVFAVADNGVSVEEPMDIIIKVSDQNDNKPLFTEECFRGTVPEGSRGGTPVMTVSANDADDGIDTYNGVVTYFILDQEPKLPSNPMFTIDKDTGLISVISTGLDRERFPEYTLTLRAIDQEGNGLFTDGKAVITVTDTNDNAPIFDPTTYTGNVPENEVGYEVARLTVNDDDLPGTDAWIAEYKIIKGNEGGFFKVETVEGNNGLVTTIKGLDFEGPKNVYPLSITVVNKVAFSVMLPTSTAILNVTVLDVNEAPIFKPQNYSVSVSEDEPEGKEVASYTATDPDKYQNQKITYSMGNDPAGWLSVNKDNGIITGNGKLDRESVYVKNNVYRAIILAMDSGSPVATGTGTLLLTLLDVNDNGPYLESTQLSVCQNDENPIIVPIIDRDETPNTGPFTVELPRESRENWTATVVGNNLHIRQLKVLDFDEYDVPIILKDNLDLANTTRLKITVCKCNADTKTCEARAALAGGLGVPAIIGILAGILCLLILVLLLLLFMRRKKVVKEPLLPPEDETRDNVYYYDEEGGGEEDQDFDLSQLHRGLDARPDVIRNDVEPTFLPAPQYRPRPSNPDEIGNFIDENLHAADNDPTAPPYDSLLVFDYEGSGSEAASLSSLNSSNSDGDQDYSGLRDWGPRFNKLADMYGGNED